MSENYKEKLKNSILDKELFKQIENDFQNNDNGIKELHDLKIEIENLIYEIINNYPKNIKIDKFYNIIEISIFNSLVIYNKFLILSNFYKNTLYRNIITLFNLPFKIIKCNDGVIIFECDKTILMNSIKNNINKKTYENNKEFNKLLKIIKYNDKSANSSNNNNTNPPISTPPIQEGEEIDKEKQLMIKKHKNVIRDKFYNVMNNIYSYRDDLRENLDKFVVLTRQLNSNNVLYTFNIDITEEKIEFVKKISNKYTDEQISQNDNLIYLKLIKDILPLIESIKYLHDEPHTKNDLLALNFITHTGQKRFSIKSVTNKNIIIVGIQKIKKKPKT